tara:strand:+ start:5138 stop:5608 length:471 start_codon:yes stop_codon:yes gene_type:complete
MSSKEPDKRPIIALSGGFDPPTEGQVSMILDAAQYGDVVIILNSDNWCDQARHLGCWMTWERRKKILENIPGVIDVVSVDDSNGDVCKALQSLKPDFFGNGGKRTLANTPEVEVCKKEGIGMLWLLGDNEKQRVRDVLHKATIFAHGKKPEEDDAI